VKIESLLEVLPDHFSALDREQILRAYTFAEKAHQGQTRASGEPYITHTVAVAAILSEMRVPPAVIIAGLLHDTVEDTEVTLDDIRREFGMEVAALVDGVTKLTNLPNVSRDDQIVRAPGIAEAGRTKESREQPAFPNDDADLPDPASPRSRKADLASETLRKTFMAMGEDIRVVLIKLADRLHNMRTLGYMPENKRKRIAKETLDIFAPLANRLGIWQIKWELEDLGFRYVNPDKYKEIAQNLAIRRTDRESQIEKIAARLKTELEKNSIAVEISGRPKHIFSIYRKMMEKGKPFEMVRDLRGIRLIVADIPACYAALGIIHTNWRPIPHEFDDYIAAPKDNFYQSIHTAIIYDDGKPLEVQIRTHEMHEKAEYGIAAHWRYKEKGGKKDDAYEQSINWIRQLMDWRTDVDDAQEFVDGMKTDVFQDRVYIFTPRGDIIDLPSGSTPIDFAYHVHTEIGHRCRGAKVNSKLVTLDHTLKTGDQVEILTAKHGGPSRDWLNTNLGLVKTQRARSKIRAWFKKQDRDQNIIQGKAQLERELKRLGVTDVELEKLARDFYYPAVEDLYEDIGCGDISIGRIINKLSEADKEQQMRILEVHAPQEPKKSSNAVRVLGLKGILTTFARCCNPAPGDEIIGYITRGRGATVHRQDCPNMLRLKDRDRIVKVAWGEPQQTYPVAVHIKAYDRQGLMGDISNILNNEGINLLDINLKVTHNLAGINLIVEVGDISQLSRVLSRLENLPNVMEARRQKPG
jgi:GTP pyrophosphokinase